MCLVQQVQVLMIHEIELMDSSDQVPLDDVLAG
jgi:hypothetical protein